MQKPTKTFGLDEPVDLYRKLLFDIERLRVGSKRCPDPTFRIIT
ncbi:hypothetical protein [Neorhizobium sp. T6_25]|nr:hypothetical protein [Neorhizobium sp. T6_25]